MQKSTISIGPFHPLQEEPEHFRLTVEGETVLDVDVEIGYNHRGIEKLSESRNFEQSTFLIERICGICSTSHPVAYTRAVEDIIPVRCLKGHNISARLLPKERGSTPTCSGTVWRVTFWDTTPSTCGCGDCGRRSSM